MTADFSKPIISDAVEDIFGTILQDIHTTLALAFDGTTATNIPIGAFGYDSTNGTPTKWNGSAWVPSPIKNLGAGVVGNTNVAANAIDDTQFRARNNNLIRVRNQANTGDIGAFGVNDADNTVINAATGKSIALCVAGTGIYAADSSKLYPVSNDAKDLGGSSNHFLNGYIRNIKDALLVQSTGSDLTIGPTDSHDVIVQAGGSSRWKFLSGGAFVPNNASAYQIGQAGVGVLEAFIAKVSSPNSTNLDLNAVSGQALRMLINDVAYAQLVHVASSIYSLQPTADGGADLGSPTNRWGILYSEQIGSPAHFNGNIYSTNFFFTPTLAFTADTGTGNPVFLNFPTQLSAGAIAKYILVQLTTGGTVYKMALYA